MTVMLLLIIASILLAGGFLAAFLWAVRSGQYDDRHTPSMRILFDELPHKNITPAGTKEPTTTTESDMENTKSKN